MSRKQVLLPAKLTPLVAEDKRRVTPVPLVGPLTAAARGFISGTGEACDRWSIDIRYSMPIFADEILRRKG